MDDDRRNTGSIVVTQFCSRAMTKLSRTSSANTSELQKVGPGLSRMDNSSSNDRILLAKAMVCAYSITGSA
mgnify:CR=1 FL=1